MAFFGPSWDGLESGQRRMARSRDGRILNPMRVAGKILYWLAVLAVSIVLLIVLVKFFESRDSSQIDSGLVPAKLVV